MKAISNGLFRNKTLKELILVKNFFSNDNVTLLCKILKSNRTLVTLDWSKSCVEDKGATAAAGALKANSTLKSLSLRGCRIKDVGAIALYKALEVNNTSLAGMVRPDRSIKSYAHNHALENKCSDPVKKMFKEDNKVAKRVKIEFKQSKKSQS
eukprot:TRINITY_DN8650_c0_g1_i1.p1 TRINITY_DN8650_c0_g1~~TRINITY_DN8650_c0_g1_i1.p1  ORF type:complete len:153 (-),score=35.27 TRINITY_DN8650_c0_g1_i1:126-584(-)